MGFEVAPCQPDTKVEVFTTHPDEEHYKDPPNSFFRTLKHIGPGLIVVGGCVGSGELIATTSTGGKAGIALLWLIIFGCVIKVLVQIEFARYTIFSGRATMAAFSILPGPSMPHCCGAQGNEQRRNSRGHWLIWLWMLSYVIGVIALYGGILSGVGQALAMCFPVTAAGAQYNSFTDQHTKWIIEDTRWPDNRSTLPTYRTMHTQWKKDSQYQEEQALDDGKRRFLKLCEKQERKNCNQLLLNSSTVQTLVETLGSRGRQSARDVGADVNTYNTTKFLSSLGTWPSAANDDIFWSLVTVALTSVILAVGRYGLIQHFSTVLVMAFTGVSIVNIVMLQTDPIWRLTWSDIWYGLSFHLSPPVSEKNVADGTDETEEPKNDNAYSALAMAMATFGIIGVSPGQIIQYPYWCIEKGYARYTGAKPVCPFVLISDEKPPWGTKISRFLPRFLARGVQPVASFELSSGSSTAAFQRNNGTFQPAVSSISISNDDDELEHAIASWRKADQAWLRRAKGWIRVLYWDAWLAMVLYTFTTIAFYLMGAAILHRTGLDPRGTQMIRYLAIMYEPAFGSASRVVFIVGAVAVLYSTLFIDSAASARLLQDALVQIRVWDAPTDEAMYRQRVRLLSTVLPWPPLIVTVTRADPRGLILFGGFLASAFLPLLALAALYFYFVGIDDDRIKPRPSIRWLWDTLLCLSALSICLSGLYACWLSFIQ